MDAPPTYEQALAAKGLNGAAQQPAYKIQDQNQNLHNSDAENHNFIPTYGRVPPSYSQDPSYQDARLVTVVMSPPQTTRTVIVERSNEVNHCLHCCITFLFWPWIFVWIFLCLVSE